LKKKGKTSERIRAAAAAPNHPESGLLQGTAVALAAFDGNFQCLDVLLQHVPIRKCCILPFRDRCGALTDSEDNFESVIYDEYQLPPHSYQPFWYCDQSLKFSTIFAAVRGGYIDAVGRLLKAGYLPDTLSLVAAIMWKMDVVVTKFTTYEAFLQAGAPGLLTPLQAAVMRKDASLVQALLSKEWMSTLRLGFSA